MATTKKNTYSTIAEELSWLELKCQQIKEFVDDNPYHLVQDRMMTVGKEFDSDGNVVGEAYKLVATIEAQHKSLRDSLKELGQILEVIDKLREKEQAKFEARGNVELSGIQKKFLENK